MHLSLTNMRLWANNAWFECWIIECHPIRKSILCEVAFITAQILGYFLKLDKELSIFIWEYRSGQHIFHVTILKRLRERLVKFLWRENLTDILRHCWGEIMKLFCNVSALFNNEDEVWSHWAFSYRFFFFFSNLISNAEFSNEIVIKKQHSLKSKASRCQLIWNLLDLVTSWNVQIYGNTNERLLLMIYALGEPYYFLKASEAALWIHVHYPKRCPLFLQIWRSWKQVHLTARMLKRRFWSVRKQFFQKLNQVLVILTLGPKLRTVFLP